MASLIKFPVYNTIIPPLKVRPPEESKVKPASQVLAAPSYCSIPDFTCSRLSEKKAHSSKKSPDKIKPYSLNELKEFAKKCGINSSQRKGELVKQLKEMFNC